VRPFNSHLKRHGGKRRQSFQWLVDIHGKKGVVLVKYLGGVDGRIEARDGERRRERRGDVA